MSQLLNELIGTTEGYSTLDHLTVTDADLECYEESIMDNVHAMSEAQAECDRLTLTSEELSDHLDALTSQHQILANIVATEERALSKSEIQLAILGLSAVAGSPSEDVFGSMESYRGAGDESGMMQDTELFLEGMKETLIKIWNAIKAAVKSVIARVKEIYANMFDANVKTAKAAKAIIEKAGKMKDATAKGDTFKVAAAKLIAYEGAVDYASVKKGKEAVLQATDLRESTIVLAENYFTAALDAYTVTKIGDQEKVKGWFTKLKDGIIDVTTKVFKGKGIEKYNDRVLPGGYAFKVDEMPNKGKGGSEILGSYPSVTIVKSKNVKENISEETKVWSLNEIVELAKSVEVITSDIDKKKSRVEKLSKTQENVIKTAESFVKSLNEETGWKESQAKSALKYAEKDAMKSLKSVDAYLSVMSRAYVQAAKSALKQYKSAK